MIYYLVISPTQISKAVLDESASFMKSVYERDFRGVYYRVKTKRQLDHPHRMFVEGDGMVLEAKVLPQINLVHNIPLSDQKLQCFIEDIRKSTQKYTSFMLHPLHVGDYDSDFTLFLEYAKNQTYIDLKKDLVEVSKPYISPIEYEQYQSTPIVPHMTIIYDDIDPDKIKDVKKQLHKETLFKDVPVDEVLLWRFTLTEQIVVASFQLVK